MNIAIGRLGAGMAVGVLLLATSVVPSVGAGPYTIVTVVKLIGVNWFNRMDEGIKGH